MKMKKNGFVVGMAVMVLTFGLALVGCTSVPKPIGDPQNQRDVLAGNTYVHQVFGFAEVWVFNYDGTVTVVKINSMIAMVKKAEPVPYSLNGTTGAFTTKDGEEVNFTVDSTAKQLTKTEDGTELTLKK
jgi:hypothetical protein